MGCYSTQREAFFLLKRRRQPRGPGTRALAEDQADEGQCQHPGPRPKALVRIGLSLPCRKNTKHDQKMLVLGEGDRGSLLGKRGRLLASPCFLAGCISCCIF